MQRLWFAPGPVPMEETIKIEWSHRSQQFSSIFIETKELLENLVNKQITIIQGSASAAIESVLDGLRLAYKKVLVINNGAFAQRVVDRLNRIGLMVDEVQSTDVACLSFSKYQAVYAVQFETSNSTLNSLGRLGELCRCGGVPFIVDAVSAFPYYELPSCDVAILSSSKQLRGLPVLGIVAYDNEDKFETTGDYLDIRKAIEYGRKGQTPHTSLIPQVLSLHNSLKKKLWKPYVDSIMSNAVVLSKGLEDIVVGESLAPVVTLQTKQVEKVLYCLKEVGLEPYYNTAYSGNRIQVSCFNYKAMTPYRFLNSELIELRKEGFL